YSMGAAPSREERLEWTVTAELGCGHGLALLDQPPGSPPLVTVDHLARGSRLAGWLLQVWRGRWRAMLAGGEEGCA
ncbi:MAG: hypothetical protein SGPRY_008042, partial [Prymnesium sp.]